MGRFSPYSLYISTQRRVQGKGGDALGVHPPFFCNDLIFAISNQFEELQTLLFEVELIINNAQLTYIYSSTLSFGI